MEFDVFQVVPDEKRRVVRKSNYHPNISREVLILDDCDDEAFLPLLSPDIRSDNRLSESCVKSFSDEQNLKKHTHTIHDKKGMPETQSSSVEKFKCEICQHNLSSKRNLNVHIENIHEGLKRFKCDKCSQKFTEKKALTLHIKGVHEKIHTWQLRFQKRAVLT